MSKQLRELLVGLLCGVAALVAAPDAAHAQLDQSCVVSILNRTVQVSPQGGWSMPNVPSNMGKVRARATCVQNNQTISGESDYFAVTTNGLVQVGEIKFGSLDPIPVSLAFTQQGTTTLSTVGATYQIGLRATYADGSVKDVTQAASGANYSSTNSGVATVSPDGLVTAVSSGTVLITARKDEVVAIKEVVVNVGGDSDGDGLPDNYELARGLNPNDPIDAQEDVDGDSLTALREFQLGTDPRKADTDSDGISDGDEVAGKNGFATSPLLADTDGDGLSDRIELLAGSSPLDPNDKNFAGALDRISVTPSTLVLTFNTVSSEASAQLTVTGVLIDGSTVNLTRKTSGTTYNSSDLSVASFGLTDGEIFAGQSGSASITIANSGKQVTVPVTVESFQPVALSALSIPGYANNVDVAGDFAFVAAGSAGLQVVDVSDRTKPTIAASLDTDGTAIDVRVFGNYAYVADGAAGLEIIDVQNPRAPQLVSSIDTAGIAQDVKVDRQIAYVADGAKGLVIVDVHDPAAPVEKSELGGFGDAKGVDALGNRAVVVAGNSLVVLDVSNPAAPLVVGNLGIGDVKDVVTDGNYAYLAVYGSGYRVVDIRNPAAPVVIGGDARIAPRDVELTDDFAFFAEQLFPNVVAYVNVQDPANPLFQGVINLAPLGDFAGTGVAVDGSYVYVTEESYVVSSDYKADGVTKLFIAQYRLINDKAGIPPTLSITRPLANSPVVEGTTISVDVTATDDVGVRAVVFAVDGQTVFTDSTQPYQIPVSIPFGKTGVRITATATDFGNNTASQELTLRVLADTDRDALGDEQETLVYHTDINNPDTDADGLKDGFEVALGTNPLVADTDGDGKTDKQEVDADTDPLNPDVTPPTITATVPAPGDTGVPENQPVTVTFSERLRASSVKASSITLTHNGAPAAGTVQLLGNGTQVVFAPTGLLADFSEYEVTVSGLRDVAGNPLAAPLVFRYTTGNVVDTEPPQIVATNPAASASDAPVNTAVVVVLNEPVDPATVNDATFYVYDSQGLVAGTGSLEEDGRTLAFVPNAALSVKRPHTVYVTGVKDLFGNAMNRSFSFTTGFTADSTAPQIVATSVQPDQTGLPTNVVMSVAFNEPVSALTLANIQLTQGADPLPVTRQFNADHSVVTLQYGQPLQPATTYSIGVSGVEDLSGNVLAAPRTLSFTTGAGLDQAAPTVVSRAPLSGSTGVPLNPLLEVQYSERMNPALVRTDSAQLYDGATGLYLAGVSSLGADGTTVRFTPSVPLQPNHSYALYLGYAGTLQDLAGNNALANATSFTTGSATRTTAPQVSLSSLADGVTGVPVNGKLVLQFDTALLDRCVSAQTVQVSSASGPVAGALALTNDRRQLTFTPSAALTASTTYTLSLNGLCDLAGNVLSGVTSSFTTSATATADTTPPTVVIAPASGATGVSATTAVTFTFNEAIDVTTLASGIQVAVSGLSGEVAGDLSVTGNVVTFTTVEPLPGNTRINVSVSSVRDLAGNPRSASSFFTTGVGTDVTAPKLVSITPNDKALDIDLGTPIVLTFSESLNPTTVTNANFALFVNGGIVRPSVSRSDDNRTVILTASLPASSVVTVIVGSEVLDLSGNALSDFASVFTTRVASDTTRPSVVRQFPGSGAYGVLPDASIVLFTNDAMKESSLASALHVAQNGQLVTGTLSTSASGQAIVFRPLQPWAPNALVEVYLDSNAQDLSANALVNYQGQFRVDADPLATQPGIVSTSATASLPLNTVMELGFNQALNPATVSGATVNLLSSYGSGAALPATVSLIRGGRVIRVVPQSPLAPNTTYYLRLSNGILDTDGQAAQAACCYGFATAAGAGVDGVAPKVLAMSPPEGATGVGINGYVHARFDEIMNPLSLWQTQTTYESLYWNDGNRSVEFMPHAPYAPNRTVTASVAAAEDLAANGAASPNSATFTTGAAPDFSPPVIVDETPFSGATGVAVNALIRLRMSEPLDPVSVNDSTTYLYSGQDGQLDGTVTLEPDGLTLTYVPARALAVNRSYTVYAYGVRDLSGNIGYRAVSFTTGLASDGQSPVVTGTSVENGLTDVPTNATLSVTFDEPISEQKLSGLTLTQGGSLVATTPELSGDHRTATLRLQQVLQQQTSYVLHVSAVEDLSGNVLAAPRTVSFTTGGGLDLVAPTVVGRTPLSGASGVPLNALFEVQYSERLSRALVRVDTAQLYDNATGQYLAGLSSLSADGTTVRFVPSVPLEPSHGYSLYVGYSGTLQDLAGNNASATAASFTTGSAARTSAPQVSLSSLADGVTGVPVNGKVVLQFDTALLDRCVNAQSVQVSSAGGAVAGALALSTDRRQITFTPSAALAASTTYTLSLNGVCDLSGNALTGVSSSFTTSATATADTTPPTVVIAPASAATGVSASAPVTFTFNEAIDVTTLASGIQVSVNGLTGEVAGELSVSGNVVTFTPVEPFPGNTRINVTVSAVRDLAGNPRSASSFFTTGVGTDVTSPKLLSVTPNDKALDIDVGTPIVLTFSESLNPNTVTNANFALFVNGGIVRPSVSRSDDNRTVILTASLPASSVVTVIVGSEVLDLSGNALADFASVFTTSVATDTARPSVVRQFPGSGSGGVLPDASIVLFTNEVMNESTLPGALHVAQNGQLVTGTLSTSASGQAIVFRPLQPWAPSALVELYLDSNARDSSGNPLNSYQGQFYIAADPLATLPGIVSVSATTNLPRNTVMDLGFNQTLNAATVSGATVNLLSQYGTGPSLAATVSLIGGGRVIRVAPQSPLAPNTTYYVRLANGIQDTDGQAVPAACCYGFATAAAAVVDNVAPKVSAMNPPDGSTGVGINGYVHARFDEVMNPLSLWQSQTLYESLFWSDGNSSVEFMPHAPYAPSSAVTESVAQAQDLAGNGASSPNSTTFTTGAGPDFTAPAIVDETPFASATGVAVNALIRLRMSEPLDPVSVNSSSTYLYSGQDGQLAGTVTLEADGRTLTYVPAAALVANRTYTVYAYGVKDLSGNIGYRAVSFTTGAAADSQSPIVTGTSVESGFTGVPTNAVLSVTFDEAINEQKLSGLTLTQGGSPVGTTPVLGADHRTATLRLQQVLQTQTTYELNVSGVEDLSGNALAAPRTVSFTTGGGLDLVSPTIVTRTPASGATGVLSSSPLSLQYSERLSRATLRDNSAQLYDNATGQYLAGVSSLSLDGTTLSFSPSVPLQTNHGYTLYWGYTGALQDLAGNNAPITAVSFTTGAQ